MGLGGRTKSLEAIVVVVVMAVGAGQPARTSQLRCNRFPYGKKRGMDLMVDYSFITRVKKLFVRGGLPHLRMACRARWGTVEYFHFAECWRSSFLKSRISV